MTLDPRRVYKEEAARGASPVRLVVLLYEQAIADLRGALAALDQGDTEGRTLGIGHALAVVGELQATLDMERGGEVARNLERFYSVLRASLLQAQIKVSKHILQAQLSNLLSLREAWVEVERAASAGVSPPASPAPRAPASPVPGERPPVEWRA